MSELAFDLDVLLVAVFAQPAIALLPVLLAERVRVEAQLVYGLLGGLFRGSIVVVVSPTIILTLG
jgi:hypothetical protein